MVAVLPLLQAGCLGKQTHRASTVYFPRRFILPGFNLKLNMPEMTFQVKNLRACTIKETLLVIAALKRTFSGGRVEGC